MPSLKRALAAALAAAPVAAPVAAAVLTGAGPAAAQMVYKDDSGGEVELYGQISPTFQYFDDGEGDYGNAADNAHSNSRVGLNVRQDFGDGFGLRFNAEVATGAPQTDGFSQSNNPAWDWDETNIRKAEFILSSPYGTLSLGQGSMATDGIAEQDLSGTGMVGYSGSAGDSAGSYLFRSHSGVPTGIAIGDAFDNLDGGRRARVRYDTPAFHGFSLSAAYGTEVLADHNDDQFYDFGVNYANTFDETFEVAASFGPAWRDIEHGGTDRRWSGSVAVLHHPTGLNAAFSGGSAHGGGSYFYLKAGWLADLLSIGHTAISADYYDGDDFVRGGASSTNWGLQLSQKVDRYNLEAYVGYRAYDYDDHTGIGYQGASSVLTGLNWRF